MITEKDTIKCEVVYDDSKQHRLMWKQVWDAKKPLACVIMINPCQASTVITDTTTYLVVNNIANLGDYGGVTIVNLFSLLTPKLHFTLPMVLNDKDNDSYIRKAAEEASVVILAWGKGADTNLKIAERARQVVAMLEPQKEKLRVISDGERMGMHPLTPALRSQWLLADPTEWLEAMKESKPQSNSSTDKPKNAKKEKSVDF
jgi:hypothetical protein